MPIGKNETAQKNRVGAQLERSNRKEFASDLRQIQIYESFR